MGCSNNLEAANSCNAFYTKKVQKLQTNLSTETTATPSVSLQNNIHFSFHRVGTVGGSMASQ
ncbi:Hypothetical protein FKW44_012103 [Caligus rogercresseyi]|uniref:Uncharacterized protein n=1 Tax=Caligus rogercresseyi TaxID=217165 RepID=A0A7T8K9A5_CALRO|nr:Hypothetical protein FKW44_012103 [Caligus rogercresseyi]